MHLVFLNQYYPPDAAPTGVMLAAVAEELMRQGHEVTVICAAGSGYAPRSAGVPPTLHGMEVTKKLQRDAPTTNWSETLQPLSAGAALHAAETGAPSRRESTTDNGPSITILRPGATRFGRGTLVGKLVDYASYYLGVTWKLLWLRPRPERVVALTTPPFLSVVARAVTKLRGGDHAHWVMDLYPDVMVAHGMLAENGFGHRALRGLASWGFSGRRCAAVLTLGPDMASRTAAVVGHGEGPSNMEGTAVEPGFKARTPEQGPKVTWVPLWGEGPPRSVGILPTSSSPPFTQNSAIEEPGQDAPATVWSETLQPPGAVAELRLKRGWKDDELVVMYSGNMGLGHRFGEILNAALGMTQEPVRFAFFGGGKRRREVEAFVAAHPESPMELHDYVPASELADHLRSGDVHLVSLDPAWTGTMLPSKLQGIFAVGRPVIFIGSGESSMGRWVAESGGGWVVEAGDTRGLRAALDEARDPSERERRGQAARAFAGKVFDPTTNIRRVAEVFGLQRE